MKTAITGTTYPITRWYKGELDEEFIEVENKINTLLKSTSEKYKVQIVIDAEKNIGQVELTFCVDNDSSIF